MATIDKEAHLAYLDWADGDKNNDNLPEKSIYYFEDVFKLVQAEASRIDESRKTKTHSDKEKKSLILLADGCRKLLLFEEMLTDECTAQLKDIEDDAKYILKEEYNHRYRFKWGYDTKKTII